MTHIGVYVNINKKFNESDDHDININNETKDKMLL